MENVPTEAMLDAARKTTDEWLTLYDSAMKPIHKCSPDIWKNVCDGLSGRIYDAMLKARG